MREPLLMLLCFGWQVRGWCDQPHWQDVPWDVHPALPAKWNLCNASGKLKHFILDLIFFTGWIAVPKMQGIKDFFFPQKHIILHLPQQCSIFLALRQISDKNNFPFKQIYCFIVKCDCRNRSTKLKCSLWFLADLAMSES